METKKRALGKGLEQLFNNENLDLDSFEKNVYATATNEEIVEINVNELSVLLSSSNSLSLKNPC